MREDCRRPWGGPATRRHRHEVRHCIRQHRPVHRPRARRSSSLRPLEAAGFESLWTVEHVIVPSNYESAYPYDPSGKMPGSEEMPIPDPLIWLAYLAAATSRINLGDRCGDPAAAQPGGARQGTRHARPPLGWPHAPAVSVSAGWRRSSTRSVCRSPSVAAAPTTTSPRCVRCGRRTRPATTASSPTSTTASCGRGPVQPSIPIHVGGHTDIAARRAGRLGDGFFPGKGTHARAGTLVRHRPRDSRRSRARPAARSR